MFFGSQNGYQDPTINACPGSCMDIVSSSDGCGGTQGFAGCSGSCYVMCANNCGNTCVAGCIDICSTGAQSLGCFGIACVLFCTGGCGSGCAYGCTGTAK